LTPWHEKYRERYDRLKRAGKSFFPYAVFKDTLVAFLLMAALVFLAHRLGAKLDDLADPTDSSYNPRPEWYFLFLFQALKYFPGKMEAVAAILLPGVGLAVLFLLPVLDRGPERHPLRRPFWTALGILALGGWGYLTWEGLRSPMTNPITEQNPMAVQGRRLYQDLKCYYCHSIHGHGGKVGPDLAIVAGLQTDAWLTKHFRNPQAVTPGTPMPKMNLLDDEIKSLIAYLRTLGIGEPYTKDAPKIFTANCAVCHKLGKEGQEIGPDLTNIGAGRDKSFIKRYIEDPTLFNAKSVMPKFNSQLTAVEIEDLSRYLAVQGQK
jgi:mono/diheme cytochrome c family protein